LNHSSLNHSLKGKNSKTLLGNVQIS